MTETCHIATKLIDESFSLKALRYVICDGSRLIRAKI